MSLGPGQIRFSFIMTRSENTILRRLRSSPILGRLQVVLAFLPLSMNYPGRVEGVPARVTRKDYTDLSQLWNRACRFKHPVITSVYGALSVFITAQFVYEFGVLDRLASIIHLGSLTALIAGLGCLVALPMLNRCFCSGLVMRDCAS